MSALVDRISEVLREVIRTELGLRSGEYFPSAVFDKAAERVAAELQLTEERERHRKCICRHSEVDHDMYRDGKCQANMVTRHTPCPCAHWQPQQRVRWVSAWSEVQP